MKYEVGQVYISKERIQARISELADVFDQFYKEDLPIIIPLLTGSFIFAADFIRNLKSNPIVKFVKCSSYYARTVSTGQVIIEGLKTIDLHGKRVLILEDIIDTGVTLSTLAKELENQKIKDLKTMALFDKPSRRKTNFNVDFVGFEIPDLFLVGFGLDYNEQYRGLPQVHILREVE